MSLTTDPQDPRLKEGQKDTGQNEVYLVLSEEERQKGFVRPYRDSYLHLGRDVSKYGDPQPLTPEQHERYDQYGYVAFMPMLDPESSITGQFLTQKDLYALKNGRLGGCGGLTIMAKEIAETYARDPYFYGATYCCRCMKHFPLDEFVWTGTNITVGT